MKIFVQAKPNSHEHLVERIDDQHYVVSVKEPPVQGMANRAIVKVLSEYFNTTQMHVRIVSGFTSRQKVIEIF